MKILKRQICLRLFANLEMFSSYFHMHKQQIYILKNNANFKKKFSKLIKNILKPCRTRGQAIQ